MSDVEKIPEPRKYAVLQETNDDECESWLTFILYNDNEEALTHLENQLEQVDWYMVENLSTFVIETKYLVSEQTAKEMSKVDLNHYSFHRKFDGKLRMIELKLKDHYNPEKKMAKVFDKLGRGQIENYLDKEDVDQEDLTSSTPTPSDSDSESEKKTPKKLDIPAVLRKSELPRFARAKRHRAKHRRPLPL